LSDVEITAETREKMRTFNQLLTSLMPELSFLTETDQRSPS
jgi:hypothetical protein